MSITYGGVSLSHPTDDLLARWDRWRDRHAQEPSLPRGFSAPGLDHLPVPAYPDHLYRSVRLNTLVWPTGASRWAVFHALASQAQLQAIQTAATTAGNPLDLVIGTTADGGRRVSPQMYMLPPRVVFDGHSLAHPVGLLTLVDVRWFWWLKTSGTAPSVVSWSALLTGLLTAVGVSSPTIDGIHADYGAPQSSRWAALTYKPLPVLLDAACESIGCRLVMNLDGTVRVLTGTNARTREDTNWTTYRDRLEVGGRADEVVFGPSLPEKVTVVFPGETPAAEDVTLAATAVYPTATGQADAAGVLNAELPSSTAGATRTAYAAVAAADWYRWAVGRVDAVFGGICSWLPGLEDRAEYEWVVPCATYPRGRVLTRVVPWPVWDRNRYGGVPAGASDPSSGSVTCASDFFLTQITTAACWNFYRMGGTGRFADFPVDDPTDPAAGSLGVYVAAESTPPDQLAFLGKMLDACCGCGVPVLRVNKAGAKNARATMELNGVHVACADGGSGSGSDGEVYTLLLTDYCPVVVGGRKGVLFTGYDARACDGDDVPCGSEVKILALCGAECPPTVCDCGVCGTCCTGPAPFLYYALGLDTFSDHTLRGSWGWVHTTGCTWTATCNGVTSTLEFVEFVGGLPKFRLTHGGAVYEVTGWSCCGDNTLTKVSGDGPATITVKPAGRCEAADCQDREWPASLLVEILDVVLTGGAVYPHTIGDVIPLALDPTTGTGGTSPAWREALPGTPYPSPYEAYISRLNFECFASESFPGCRGYSLSDGTGPGAGAANSSGLTEDCTCDPVYFLGDGTYTCATVPNCFGGAIPNPGSVYIRVRITEAP